MADNIKIRPLRDADAKDLSRNANNINIWNNLRDYIPFPYTLEAAHDFIKFQKAEDPCYCFAITLDDILIGVIGMNAQKDVYRHSAEIGYWLGEIYWGKGYTTMAVDKMIDYAFNELNLKRLFTAVYENNPASMKVLEKVGFKKEGIGINSVLKNGKYVNEHKFGLINQKYFNQLKP